MYLQIFYMKFWFNVYNIKKQLTVINCSDKVSKTDTQDAALHI